MAKIIKTTAAPIKGRRVWYFIQSVNAKIGDPGVLPAYQTGGSLDLGGDNIDEQTKQGRIIQKATDEHNVELEQYFVPSDPALKTVEEAKVKGHSVKVWRVVVDESVAKEGTQSGEKLYPAKFGYGIPDEISYDDGDDLSSVSYSLGIIGTLQDGEFPLSDEDISVIENLYAYQNPGETTGDYDNIKRQGDSEL